MGGGEGETDLRWISFDPVGAFSTGSDGSLGWVFGTKSGRGDSLPAGAPAIRVRKSQDRRRENLPWLGEPSLISEGSVLITAFISVSTLTSGNERLYSEISARRDDAERRIYL